MQVLASGFSFVRFLEFTDMTQTILQALLDCFPDAVSEYGLLGCGGWLAGWLLLAAVPLAGLWLAIQASRVSAEALAASMEASRRAAALADARRRADARTVWRRLAR